MMKGISTFFLLLTISIIPLSAQQYVIQGVVTDSLTKEPLPYASVRLKDTTEGTTTGSDGRFYFKTNRSEAVLVISVIGYNDDSRKIHPARNSIKSEGIAKDLGLSQRLVVNCVNFKTDTDILDSFIYMEKNRMAIKERLEAVIPQYKNSNINLFEYL